MATTSPKGVTTYDKGSGTITGSNREDLLDVISIISPSDAPFSVSAPRSEAKDTHHGWFTDALAATSTAGSLQGADFVTGTYAVPVRHTNVTQIFTRNVKVTNTQRAVNAIGTDDEYKRQVMKAGREIQRNIETRVFSQAGSCAAGATDAAPIFKGLNDFMTTASHRKRLAREWGENVTSLGGASVSSCATTITEDRFNNMLEYLFHSGGSPDTIYCGAAVKRQINDFTGPSNARRNISLNDKTIIASVDLYDTEFGPMEITINRWVKRSVNTGASSVDLTGQLFALEKNLNRLAILRPVKHIPLPQAGDYVRGSVIGELTLEVLNVSGQASMAGIQNIGY